METDQHGEPLPKYGRIALLIPLLAIGEGIVIWMYTIGRGGIAALAQMVTPFVIFCLRWSAYWHTERRKRNHDDG